MTSDRLSHSPEDPADPVVLVVNDDATQLAALAALVRKAGAEPLAFISAEAALEAIANRPPSLIVTDLHMPGIDGWRFCRLLRSPEYSAVNHVPIVVVSAVFAGEEPNRIAADLGAEAFIAAPVDGAHFVGLVRNILAGNGQSQPPRVLLVENGKSQARRLAAAFEANGYRVQAARTAREAREQIAGSHYDVAVLAHHLPDGTAGELLDACRGEQPECVCLVMTEDPGTQLALDWMKRGAAAYLRKPFDPNYLVELCRRAQRERKLLQIPEELAVRTRELRESEANFRALFETIQDPIVVTDTAGHMLFANRAIHEKLGYTAEEIARMHLLDLHPPDCRREAEEIFSAMIRGERSICPLPLQRKDGGRMPVETRAWFGRWNGQTCIMGICRDLTAEQEAQGRFERIFGHCPVPMALSEAASRRFVDINEAFERTTGYRRSEVIGKTADELQLVPAKAKHAAVARNLQAEGRITGEELTVRHRDGSLIDGLFTGEVFDLHGKTHSLTAMIDITERKRAEREREVVLALLSHLNQIDALPELLRAVTSLLRDWSGCEAVGIRLRDGNDYPYYETAGFPEEFVMQENSLCSTETRDGDGCGSPVLECMCGNVIMGRFDPSLPFFTEYGSFWTNSTSALLASSSEEERQARTRNRCHGEGYESVALIPLRHGETTMGLLQINDRRPDQFNKDQVALFERLACHLVIGLKQLESERARQRSEKKYRTLIENQNDLVVQFDPEKRILFASPNYCETFGKELTELAGQTFLPMIHPEDKPLVEDSLDSALSPPYFTEHEERARTVNGWRWFAWSAKAVLDEDGKAESIISVGRDITKQKGMEEALKRSEEEYRTLFQEMLEGFALHEVVCDDAGNPVDYRYLKVNPAFERLTGLQGTDIVGKTVLELLPGTEPYWIEIFGKVALTGNPVFFEQYSGEIGKYLEVSAFSPNPDCFACIFSDVTERKLAEAEQERLRQQLVQAQKMEAVGQLAGGVAHDFNNMLHGILGYTELAADQLEPNHPLHAELNEIKGAAERAADLTRQLLAFARKQTVSPQPLSLNAIVDESLGMIRRLVGESLRLVWQPGGSLWTVRADPTQIGMVLTNLCVNARDAVAENGEITVATRNVTIDEAYLAAHSGGKPGDFVELSVEDDGCGMAKELLERVFDPFFTTKEVGKGTGLGLASVHGIAEQNGGFVQVASEPGKGTDFRVFLPRYRAEAVADDQDRATRPTPLPRGTETVLVAEDEEIILSICRDSLARLGYRVLAARTPGEAVAICRDHDGPIHLLLTDVVMPEMNGRGLAELAREMRPDIPCLYMSGYPAEAIARHGVVEEGVDFLQKPFSNRELAEKVRMVLDRTESGERGR